MNFFVAALTAYFSLITLAAAAPPESSSPVRERADVVIANRPIITLYGPIAGYSARERADGSIERIEQMLDSDEHPQVSTLPEPDGTEVLVGGKPAFLVTAIDIDPQIGETTEYVARGAATRLEKAEAEYAEQHAAGFLLVAAALIALATLIYAVFLRVLFLVDARSERWLAQLAEARAQKLHVRGVSLLDAHQVGTIARRIARLVAWTLALFATYGWLTFSLMRIPYTQPWGEHMQGKLLGIVWDVVLASVSAVPGLVVVVLIILIARVLIRLAALFFDRVEQGRLVVGGLDADTAVPTRRLVGAAVWLFAFALAYPYLPGAKTDAFKGLSVLVGIMVSIGASGIVGQATSGFILMYTRTFRAGEYVRIGDAEGTVAGVGVFTTRIRTGLGEELLLPNSLVLQHVTRNYSRAVPGTGYVVDTVVTIGYSTPWRQVHAMLMEAARMTLDIATAPAPYVRQTSLSDFYVQYRLVAYTSAERPAQRADVLSRLHANIQDVFNSYGVQIMSPHYMTDPAESQSVPKARWYAAPADLSEGPPRSDDPKR